MAAQASQLQQLMARFKVRDLKPQRRRPSVSTMSSVASVRKPIQTEAARSLVLDRRIEGASEPKEESEYRAF